MADCTAGAEVVIDLVALAGPELDNRALGAGAEAAVTLEAVATGHAAPGLVGGRLFVQVTHDLGESAGSSHHVQTRPVRP